MIRATPACRHALRVLSHPWSILAVSLLVVNDHVLKRHWPSALTGKISDLAGVFFFPFLLACALGLANRSAGDDRARRRVGLLSLGITGLWFAAMKLEPTVNAWTGRLTTWVTGQDARIVMDPTDLVALVMLWPAWRLWRRTTAPERGAWPAWAHPVAQAAVLLAASFATMATSCAGQQEVRRVMIEGDRMLAGLTYLQVTVVTSVFTSDDGGATWSPMEDQAAMGASSLAMMERPDARPGEHAPACAPPDRTTCYRVAGEDHVEVSRDAGATWSTSWRVTPARKAYRERFLHGWSPRFDGPCPSVIDPGPFDLAILGEGERHTVLVAAGSEGVLVLGPEGRWTQVGVGIVQPTPLRANALTTEVWVPIRLELLASLLAAGAAASLSMRRSRRRLRLVSDEELTAAPAPAQEAAQAQMATWSFALPVVFLGLGLTLTFWPILLIAGVAFMEGRGTMVTALIGLAVFIVAMVRSLRSRGWGGQGDSAVKRALRRSLGAGALTFAAVLGPMVLWSVGAIPNYPAASALALALGLGALILASRYPVPAEP